MDFDIFLLKGEDLIQPMPMSVNLVLNLKTAIYITLQIGNSSLQVSQLVNPQGGGVQSNIYPILTTNRTVFDVCTAGL